LKKLNKVILIILKNTSNPHPKDLSKSPAVVGFFVCRVGCLILDFLINNQYEGENKR